MPLNTIPGTPLATATTPGSMSVAQNNKLEAMASAGWGDLQISRMQTRHANAINVAWASPVTLLSLVNSAVVSVDGGGITLPNYASTSWWYGTQSLLATPRTSRWSVAFRAKWTSAARDTLFGICDGSTWAFIAIRATGVFGLWAGNGGTSSNCAVNVDANWHDLMISADGTNLYLDLDGVEIHRVTAGLGSIPASQGRIAGGTNGATADLTITDVAFGVER